MRDYGKVHTSFWSSPTITKLSEDGRTLAFYLITSPHSTIAGCFRLPDGYVCEDLRWTAERVSKGFAELFTNGYANRCETSKWVWVLKHLEWNKPENPNQRKSAAKIALSIPDECGWKLDFMRVCGPLLDIEWTQTDNACETLSEPFLNQEQKQEQEQEQDSSSLRSEEAAPKARSPRPKKEECTLGTYLVTCKAEGRKPLPANHSIRDYCRDAGIPEEMLQIGWIVFRDDYTTGEKKSKRQKDWPATFANSVKGRWYRLWFTNTDGAAEWTSNGMQAKKVIEARLAQKEIPNEHA